MPADSAAAKAILLIAPQPFYQDRGTPIAVKLLAGELARLGYRVDLLVYHEGADIEIDGVRLFRSRRLDLIKNIGPGFSLKKLVCDLWLYGRAKQLVQTNHYHFIHAVEEAVFMAARLSRKFLIPFVYDMDSVMSAQLVDKMGFLRPLKPVFGRIEGRAIRSASGVVAMCDEIADHARSINPAVPVACLEDIDLHDADGNGNEDLRTMLGISGPLLLYVGNLETYQGIDLLLGAIGELKDRCPSAGLVVIGGSDEHISRYQALASRQGVAEQVFFVGRRDVTLLGYFLRQADILISPRIKGTNTPMKIYSYLGSGVAVLATDLPTHTQVLSTDVAWLCEPTPEAMANGIATLIDQPHLRARLGEAAQKLVSERYSLSAYRAKLAHFYEELAASIVP